MYVFRHIGYAAQEHMAGQKFSVHCSYGLVTPLHDYAGFNLIRESVLWIYEIPSKAINAKSV